MRDSDFLFWLAILLAGVAANYVWRLLGAVLARGVHPQSQFMLWVRDVSTALVAALVARLVIVPVGPLADVSLAVRAIAFGAGIAAFLALRKNLLLALMASEATFFAARWLIEGR